MYIDTSNASSGRICLNAAKADQLATARTITLSGDASGSVSFDGSQNVTLAVDISALDNINDAIDTKQATITGAATTITSSNLTASRALISNSSGKVAVSTVTSTELGYLDGVTANIQTQLNNKQNKLTFDSAPTENSTNPVTSGGIYTEVNSAKVAASLAMPGSLKWDGIIGDREHVIVLEEPIGEGITVRHALVHVSDYFPEILALMMEGTPAEERILSALFSIVGEGAGEMQVQVADDMSIMGEAFCYAPTDGYSLEGIVFPKKGWYFMSVSVIMGNIEVPVAYINGLQIEGVNFPDTNGGGSDKYFETNTETTVTELGDTLTWDGDTNGRVTITIDDRLFVKVSDCVPTVTDVANGMSFVITEGFASDVIEVSATDAQNAFLDNGVALIGACVLVIPTDNIGVDSYIFPEAGVYLVYSNAEYVSSVTIPDYNFTNTTSTTQTVIKTEHLPEALRFGEMMVETYGDTLAWDGDITKCDANIEGALYHVSDVVPNMAECVSIEASLTFEEGAHKVNVLWEHQATPDIYRFFIENVSQTLGLVVTSEIVEDTVRYPAGLYLYKDDSVYISSITFNGITPFVIKTTELVKIDPKYLPDDIGGGSGGSGLPEVSADDNGKSVSVVNGEWVVKKPSYNDLSDKPTLFSGSYNDLSDKPMLDTQMSDTSTNMVQNKVIKAYIDAAIGAAIAASY